MFEHLPVITKENFDVMKDKDLPEFMKVLKDSTDKVDTLGEMADIMCQPFIESNPLLYKTVHAAAFSGFTMLKGDAADTQLACMHILCMLLLVLRLVDRELEAKELDKLTGEGGEK